MTKLEPYNKEIYRNMTIYTQGKRKHSEMMCNNLTIYKEINGELLFIKTL